MRQVVFLMTDTQRTDMLGGYGRPDMHTPCLDRLAAAGIRFQRAYTCQPVCGPARAALFTGTFPHTNGVWSNSQPFGEIFLSLGQRLAAAGVPAAYVGKWHLDAGDYFGNGQCPPGWDPAYWYAMRNYLEELSPEDRRRSRSTALNDDPSLRADFTFADRCSNRAIDYLATHRGQDFFLAVSYDEPHHPFVCPKPYAGRHAGFRFPKSPNVWDRLADKPEHHRIWAGQAPHRDRDALEIGYQHLLDCHAFVDSEIGRVLAAIERHAPDAMVIYTSDHGDMMRSHCLTNKGAAMYEEITHVPFLVRWPGRVPRHATSRSLASHVDVTPTVLDAFGLAIPACLQGRSRLPVFADPAATVQDAVFMEFGRYEIDHDGFGGFQPIRCACDGRYKLVVNLLTTDEFYDLETDPQEMTNRIDSAAHAAARDRLHDRLLQWMNETRDPFRGYYWHRRPWRIDAPAATWDYTAMTRQRATEPGETAQLDYVTGLAIHALARKK